MLYSGSTLLCDKVFVSSHLSIAAFDWKNSNQKSQVMAYFPSSNCYKVLTSSLLTFATYQTRSSHFQTRPKIATC